MGADREITEQPICICNVTIKPAFMFGKESTGGRMVIHVGEAKFLLIGMDFEQKYPVLIRG